jgi:hypothetical protein
MTTETGGEFTEKDRTEFDCLQFEVNDPSGTFAKLKQELTGLSKKFDSGGGINFDGFTFSYDVELAQWFKDRSGKTSIFADAVAIFAFYWSYCY